MRNAGWPTSPSPARARCCWPRARPGAAGASRRAAVGVPDRLADSTARRGGELVRTRAGRDQSAGTSADRQSVAGRSTRSVDRRPAPGTAQPQPRRRTAARRRRAPAQPDGAPPRPGTRSPDPTAVPREPSRCWPQAVGAGRRAAAGRAGPAQGAGAIEVRVAGAAVRVRRCRRCTADPAELARRLRRPLPQQPARHARRGTAFHQWLEQRWSAQTLLDIDELPGAVDELADDEELVALKEAFERSAWADRTPVAGRGGLRNVVRASGRARPDGRGLPGSRRSASPSSTGRPAAATRSRPPRRGRPVGALPVGLGSTRGIRR